MKAHQIENGVVVNTIEVESLDFLPNLIEAADGGIGWLWDGTTLTPPPSPAPQVPQSVTMRQARLALLAVGKLTAINEVIASIEPAETQQRIQIEWEYAQTVDRNSQWVADLAPALGLSDEDLDNLFIFAAQQ